MVIERFLQFAGIALQAQFGSFDNQTNSNPLSNNELLKSRQFILKYIEEEEIDSVKKEMYLLDSIYNNSKPFGVRDKIW